MQYGRDTGSSARKKKNLCRQRSVRQPAKAEQKATYWGRGSGVSAAKRLQFACLLRNPLMNSKKKVKKPSSEDERGPGRTSLLAKLSDPALLDATKKKKEEMRVPHHVRYVDRGRKTGSGSVGTCPPSATENVRPPQGYRLGETIVLRTNRKRLALWGKTPVRVSRRLAEKDRDYTREPLTRTWRKRYGRRSRFFLLVVPKGWTTHAHGGNSRLTIADTKGETTKKRTRTVSFKRRLSSKKTGQGYLHLAGFTARLEGFPSDKRKRKRRAAGATPNQKGLKTIGGIYQRSQGAPHMGAVTKVSSHFGA